MGLSSNESEVRWGEDRKIGRSQFLKELANLKMRWDLFQVQWETTEGFMAKWYELIYIFRKTSLSAQWRIKIRWTRRDAETGHFSSAGKGSWWFGLGVVGGWCRSGGMLKYFHLPTFKILLMVWIWKGKDGDGWGFIPVSDGSCRWWCPLPRWGNEEKNQLRERYFVLLMLRLRFLLES